MDLLLLGGNSQNNQQWITRVSKELRPLFSNCLPHIYLHWKASKGNINKKAELKELAEEVKKLESYAIFGKSAGATLTAQGIAEGVLNPRKCIFLGFPIKPIKDKTAISSYLKSIKVPVLFIQNKLDPLGPADMLDKYLKETNMQSYRLEVMDATSHSYTDYLSLYRSISDFLSK
jgi:predicted alpha/beta-hydrolase family hydrolase